MSDTTIDITPEEMATYRQTARERQEGRTQELEARQRQAWEVARQAAEILKGEFGAQRVLVFGSLAGAAPFHERSDIDLAVWGLDERLYYRAVGQLQSLDPEFPIDLVEFEHAKPSLQERIKRDGETI